MPRACIHLNDGTDKDYAKVFSGVGTEYALICLACCAAPEAIEANLRSVSAEQFDRIEEDGCWTPESIGLIGRPEIRKRTTDLVFHHEEVAPAATFPEPVADLKPIPAARNGDCVVLTSSGELILFDPARGAARRLMNVSDTGVSLEPQLALHVSPAGDMAAVVEARGSHGMVVDLNACRPTMALDRGNYRPEHTDFPVAFFETDDGLRLVHGRDWNRLDVSDPRTGAGLTDGTPTSYRQGETRPEHYLDYFHGPLSISPGGERIVDNGWVWHPAGVVVAWNLRRWVEENPWESEDGPSRRRICARFYFWGGPLCWIDDRTLAVWGYGNDDDNLIDAALIFDAESGQLIHWFAGPAGTFVFDGYLFSFSGEAGTSVWDVKTGERLLRDDSFRPTVYHPGARQFITVRHDGGVRLSRLVGSETGIPS